MLFVVLTKHSTSTYYIFPSTQCMQHIQKHTHVCNYPHLNYIYTKVYTTFSPCYIHFLWIVKFKMHGQNFHIITAPCFCKTVQLFDFAPWLLPLHAVNALTTNGQRISLCTFLPLLVGLIHVFKPCVSVVKEINL